MDGKRKLIYADDFISSLRDDPLINGANSKRVVQHINDAPAVDAVVHGRWAIQSEYDFECGIYRIAGYTCQVCGRWNLKKSNYCHNCGAKMDGGNEDG
jgi:hypothetical protein